MDYMQQKQYSDEISRLRYRGDIDNAIKKCQEAAAAFPQNNFFFKILGDLYVQKSDYMHAAMAYLEQLKRLSEKPEQFKTFVRFYRLLETKAPKYTKHYRDAILTAVNCGEIAPNIHKQLIKNLGKEFVTNQEQIELFKKSNHDRYLQEIKQFIEQTKDDDTIRAMIHYRANAENNTSSTRTDSYLASVAERKEMYVDAQQLIKKVLIASQKMNPTIIRTFLRICRKLDDYTFAKSVLDLDDSLIEKSDFNIQYELVYYFESIGDKVSLDKTLKRMRNSAERSVPIARTLYNFYLNFNRFDEAQLIYEHIQQLKIAKHREASSLRDEEQLESEQVIWKKLKDLVSEQEHNRQMVALRELLKGFSHELGQPITNIRYAVQLQQMKIKRGKSKPSDINDLFTTILSQTTRIGTLLDRFRPIVSSKSQAIEFNVSCCISQVFSDLSSRLKDRGITYNVEGPADTYLLGDEVQFSQVFYNLVLNSMQAIDKNGRIHVKISNIQHKKAKIVFTDSGPGIPSENVMKVFEPFFSTKDPTSGNGGEGLGLFIVWNILKMFNGTIHINQKYQDGAQFIIEIPTKKETGLNE